MSKFKCSLEQLGLSKDAAEKIVSNKPAGDGEMYFMPETGLYYQLAMDKRKNALIYCQAVNTWRASARYNSELQDANLFIQMSVIKGALKKSKD